MPLRDHFRPPLDDQTVLALARSPGRPSGSVGRSIARQLLHQRRSLRILRELFHQSCCILQGAVGLARIARKQGAGREQIAISRMHDQRTIDRRESFICVPRGVETHAVDPRKAGVIGCEPYRLGKFGQDIALMAQAGDELQRAGGGSSSAMAHKRNPIDAEMLVTLARYNAVQLSGMHHALIHEQDRSGAAWTL